MAAAVSNLSSIRFGVSPLFFQSRKNPSNNGRMTCCAKAGNSIRSDARENLDHLQRPAGKQQVSQSPKKRIAQSAPLGLWDRFPSARTIQQMMDTMDSIIDDPFAYTTQRSPLASLNPEDGAMQSSYRRGRTPWEIKEKENEYKLRFDMPGMTKSDVKVWVEEKMVVIKAEKAAKEEEEEEEEWSARSFGKYNTRIGLPDNVEVEKIKAEVKDGVLYVTIPKAPATSKILDINVQ